MTLSSILRLALPMRRALLTHIKKAADKRLLEYMTIILNHDNQIKLAMRPVFACLR